MQTTPTDEYERSYYQDSVDVCGVDEVGRGAWAGPVTVGAVVLDPENIPEGLQDSKKLSAAAREKLDVLIRQTALFVNVGDVSPDDIDRSGMSKALREATVKATKGCDAPVLFVDGPVSFGPERFRNVICIPKGDSVSVTIAAASIVAKVYRDNLMAGFASTYPEYEFDVNKGYHSDRHVEAINTYGPCDIHRMSFKPIAQPTLL